MFILRFEESKQSRPKSKIELLAEQRDAKRRRVTHKKVHTSRKTHTEVRTSYLKKRQRRFFGGDEEALFLFGEIFLQLTFVFTRFYEKLSVIKWNTYRLKRLTPSQAPQLSEVLDVMYISCLSQIQ